MNNGQPIREAVREHGLLDVGIDIVRGGSGDRHEVENGLQVGHREASPVDEIGERLADVRNECVDVHERLHLAVTGRGVGDDFAAVGVPDEHDRAADRVQEVRDALTVRIEPAEGGSPARRPCSPPAGAVQQPCSSSASAHAPCTSTTVGFAPPGLCDPDDHADDEVLSAVASATTATAVMKRLMFMISSPRSWIQVATSVRVPRNCNSALLTCSACVQAMACLPVFDHPEFEVSDRGREPLPRLREREDAVRVALDDENRHVDLR